MTNRQAFEKFCKQKDIDLEVLTRQEIIDDYLEPGSGDLETVEDFTGEDMEEDDVTYWLVDKVSFFFVNKDEDFSDDEVDDMVSVADDDYDIELFEKIKSGLEE